MNSELKSPALLNNLEEIISFIKKQAKKANLSVEKINRLELAAEEALVNIIKHAYPAKEGYIKVKCKNNNHFILEIIDEGIPFNPLSAKNPRLDLDIDSRPIGGVGILLIKKMVDSVEYKRKNKSNLLRLIIKK